MSQYSYEPRGGNPGPYREWPITEPTTRREDLWLMPPKEAERHDLAGRHLAMIADSHGDICIMLATRSVTEYRAITDCPEVKRRVQQWRANSPRYGSWRYYLEDVALVRAVFEFAGWTPTPEEAALMDALDEYGRQAPARFLAAAA